MSGGMLPRLLVVAVCLSLASHGGGQAPPPSPPAPPPPPPVQSFDVGNFADTGMTASWANYTDPVGQLLDLRWRPRGSAAWTGGVELDPAAPSSYQVAGLEAGTAYEFSMQVQGVDGRGYSEAALALGETLFGTRATNVRASVVRDTSVTVVWRLATNPDIVSQKVYVSWDGGETWRFNTASDQGPLIGNAVTELVVPSLKPLSNYLFLVETLVTGAGGAIRSFPSQNVLTLATAPQKVGGLAATQVTGTSMLLGWDPLDTQELMGSNSVSYRIEIREGDAPFPDPGPFVLPGLGVSSFQINGLLRSTLHRIRITAVNDAGIESPVSDVLLATTLGTVPLPPAAPSVAVSGGGLLVSWLPLVTNEQTGGRPITAYLVHRRREDELAFDAGVSAGQATSLLVDAGLTPNYLYEMAVSALTDVASSPLSAPSLKTLPPDGPIPTAPTATVGFDARGSIITLRWQPPALASNVIAFKVFMREVAASSGFDAGHIVNEPVLEYAFLPDNTRFEFKYEALTGVGWTPQSPITVAETFDAMAPTGVVSNFLSPQCAINVSWFPPQQPPLRYRLFLNDQNGLVASSVRLTNGPETTFLITECARGSTFAVSAQALYPNDVASEISRASSPAVVPPAAPATMPIPGVVASPADPSTRVVVSWPAFLTGTQTGGSPILDVRISVAVASSGVGFAVDAPGGVTSFEVGGLLQDTLYIFRVQARNVLGYGPESPSKIFSTSFAAPDKIANFTIVPGSEVLVGSSSPTVSLTVQWSVPRSGTSVALSQYRIFKYRVGDDYNLGELFSTASAAIKNEYQLTGLPGGVDFTFLIQGINSRGIEGPLSDPQEFRTVSVVPREITSMRIVPAASPDVSSGYLVRLQWDVPIDPEITGGSALSGFFLRYAILDQCVLGCADVSAACVAQRSAIPWQASGIPNPLGPTGTYTLTATKGFTYVFSIAGRNVVGQGPFWPSCDALDTNCNRQGTPACFDPVITKPVKIVDYGVLGPGTPTTVPIGTAATRSTWGVSSTTPDPYYEYTDRQLNGGRNVLKIELQRTESTKLNQWPLDHYCPTLPSSGTCEYQIGCVPDPCVATCPICISDQNALSTSYTSHSYDDFASLDSTKTYVYRIRFSNVDTCTGGTVPVGTTSSDCYTWSDWSDIATVQLQQLQQYSNVLTQVVSPIKIRVGWVIPQNSINGPSNTGDQVRVYYGTNVAQVVAPYTGATVVDGGVSSALGSILGTTDGANGVSGLKPATTYYFSVRGFFSTGVPPTDIESTHSGPSIGARTQVGIPAQVKNVTITVPSTFVEQLNGGIIVTWSKLLDFCTASDGVFLFDGSVATCPKGEDAALRGYKIYYRQSSATTWSVIQVAGDVTTYLVTGLEKGLDYSFEVTALNSEKESVSSDMVANRTLVTVPGPPPAPLMNGASPGSLRISWLEPPDSGASVQLSLQMSEFQVVIVPRRDDQPGNETLTFTTARQTVLTGLKPNTRYQITVAAKNTFYVDFGVPSEILWATSTPLAPVNFRVLDTGSNSSFGVVTVRWDWVGVVQGPMPIIGYRITSTREGSSESTTRLCSGGNEGAELQCRLDGFARGVLYTLTIAASNDPRLETSFGPESIPLTIQTPASLPTVTVLRFSDTDAQSTTIHWATEDGGLPILGYQIRVQRESEGFSNATDITGPSNYTFRGLGPNLAYTFIVVAINSAGYRESPPSPSLRTLPAPPAPPTVTAYSTRNVSIEWPVWYGKNPVLEHRLQTRYNNGPGFVGEWFDNGRVLGSATSATAVGLNPNSGVDIRVAAANDGGVGAYSEWAHVVTLPLGPPLVYVATITAEAVQVNWREAEGADGRYSYLVYPFARVGADEIAQPAQATGQGPVQGLSVTNLNRGATYFFRVASLGPLGAGEMSEPSHDIVTLLSAPSPGAKPVASTATPNSIVVGWAATGPLDGGGSPLTAYVLFSRYERGGVYTPWVTQSVVGPTTLSVVASPLVGNAAYQFRLAARNGIGEGLPGEASDPFSTLPGPMPAPRQQAFLSTILLFWDAPVNATTTGYRVYFQEYDLTRQPSPDWSPASVQVVAATTLTMKFDSLKSDNRYRFWLASRNPSGWGADGEIIESRTTIRPDAWVQTDAGALAMVISDVFIQPTSAKLTWYGPATGNDAIGIGLRGSAVGYQVIACSVANQLCDVGTEYLTQCRETLPYSFSHCCEAGCSEYTRQGLLKNTRYYFQLAVVNPGGPGPYSRPSNSFVTKSDFVAAMGAPTPVSLGLSDSLRVFWTPVTDWNERGGLDITAYYLWRREEGSAAYVEPEVIFDGAEFVLTNLPSNTRYYFAVNAENTWCTTCPVDGPCVFPACCDDHTCTAKSPESGAISTLVGKMPTPRALETSIFSIRVTWDVIPGTPNNIFAYEMRHRDLDRQQLEDTGGWITTIFPGTGVGSYLLLGLRPNNKYEVLMRADNGEGYGELSESGILYTLAERVTAPAATQVRATEVTLAWAYPSGRQRNILGYNVTYREAAPEELLAGQALYTHLPVTFVLYPGSEPTASVINLTPNTTYVFAAAAYNGGGTSTVSLFSTPVTTMPQDRLASCLFYRVSAASRVQGYLYLQESAIGDPPSTLAGLIGGMVDGSRHRLMLRQYGQASADDYGTLTAVLLLNETRAAIGGGPLPVEALVSLPLQGPSSVLGASLLLVPEAWDGLQASILAQCEFGLAAPRGGAFRNEALPPVNTRAFCSVQSPLPHPEGGGLSGGFIASPTDRGLRVRGRVCGLPPGMSGVPLSLHTYGDLGDGSVGGMGAAGEVAFDMGSMVIDNLGSGNFDMIDEPGITFFPASPTGIVGRSVLLYHQNTTELLGACVFGAYEPGIGTTAFNEVALPGVCIACTWLLGLQESLHAVARRFRSDWITLWSLNPGITNPDVDSSGTSIYYAHPYRIAQGESATSVMARFGMTALDVSVANPGRLSYAEGDVVCVVPRWLQAIDRNNLYVCRDREVPPPEAHGNATAGLSGGGLGGGVGVGGGMVGGGGAVVEVQR